MSKGHSFKVLAPKDIAAVLNMIGVHPAVTAETIDKPTPEIAVSFFQNLSEFAYDMDAQQVRAQMPSVVQHWGHQHAEIYDEVMEVLTVFRLSRQLALINLVDDFSLKDLWEPNSKRFRTLLSALINFCRYKEGKVTVITGMKEDLQALDGARIELVDKSAHIEQEMAAAQERHTQELHDIRAAEHDVQRVQGEVDKLHRQRLSAERVVEEAEAKLTGAKGRLKQLDEKKQKLRDQMVSLQGQVAESPEGIEQEIGELQDAVRQERMRLEGRSNEKRSRFQRDQVLSRLCDGLEAAREELHRLAQAAEAAAASRERSSAAREELAQLQQLVESRRADEAELEQRVRQIALEHERSKEAHEVKVKELESRRQQALVQHQHLQAKRAEEQKQQHALQTQRMELDIEVAAARRAHEAEINELRERQHALQRKAEVYAQHVDMLLLQYGTEGAAAGVLHASPERALLRQRVLCSPSPARVASNPLGFMSPGAQY